MVSPLGGVRGAIDEALEERGLQRRVVRSVPQFTVASLILKRADLVALLPETFARSSACRGLRVMQLPLELPPISMHAAWSPRYDADLRHQWLRGLLRPTVDAVPARAGAGAMTAPLPPLGGCQVDRLAQLHRALHQPPSVLMYTR
jgi:DNA-binding transcriptional LysR family regulator